ncbi:MAG: hypothetical protein SGJ05_09575 [bacterium]|nr:hypothetical protein [bacterium]
MTRRIRILSICVLLSIAWSVCAFAQARVVVLPFRNMDGEIKYNVWSLQLSDSLTKLLLANDTTQAKFVIVPNDSVEMAISELNLDPTNPQYQSDVWKAVKAMGAVMVVQGNFFLRGERVLMNAYVYDMNTRMAHGTYFAKDIYKSPTSYMEAIPVMVKKLYPALIE